MLNFLNPTVMQPLNVIQNIPSRLRGIRVPSINSANVSKFFYTYFLGIDEDDLAAYKESLEKEKRDNEKTEMEKE